jgi:hypothetical protein
MNTETPKENAKLLRLAIVVSIATSALSAFLLLKLNGIVHGQLYGFGLQFSLDWASPYWDTERLLYVCFAVPPVVSGIALVHSFWKTRKNKVLVARRVETKPIVNGAKPCVAETKPPLPQTPIKTTRVDNSMVITCPKCRKVFGRPLNMLDFSKGPAQLVNVCPYCNYILGSAAEGDSDGTKVILPDKTEIEQK